jgi:hypothetical protein
VTDTVPDLCFFRPFRSRILKNIRLGLAYSYNLCFLCFLCMECTRRKHCGLCWYVYFLKLPYRFWSQDSVVGIATGYGLDDRGVRVRVPVGSRIFFTSSRLALGPTQPPIQRVPAALSTGVKLTTHPQLVPRSRKRGSIHPLPRTSSCSSA